MSRPPLPGRRPPGSVGVPLLLACCVAVSLAMALYRPIPGAANYLLALSLWLELSVIWLLFRVKTSWLFHRVTLTLVLLGGLALGFVGLSSLRADREIVAHYRSVFAALDQGRNPYHCGTIVHLDRNDRPVLGDFNYPPMEILPYDLARRIAGGWNAGVLLGTMLLLHLLSCLILLRTFPGVPRWWIWPFFPLLILSEVKATHSMTLLVIALLLWAMRRQHARPGPAARFLIAALFGIGLACKFLIIPLVAAYYGNRFDPRRLRSLGEIAGEAGVTLGTFLLVIAPFGVVDVLSNTILFNLILRKRAVLTTFYPNVLSGPLQWLSAGALYPFIGMVLMAWAVLNAPRFPRLTAMVIAAFAFLFVSPTPEPQSVPELVYLALSARLWSAGQDGGDLLGVAQPGLRVAAGEGGHQSGQ